MRANAMHNCTNPYQTGVEKILCVCSAGLLRSPTLAGELYKRGFNTRAAGVHDYALIPVDEVLLKWADTIMFVSKGLREHVTGIEERHQVYELDIPDRFEWRHPELVASINSTLDEMGY